MACSSGGGTDAPGGSAGNGAAAQGGAMPGSAGSLASSGSGAVAAGATSGMGVGGALSSAGASAAGGTPSAGNGGNSVGGASGGMSGGMSGGTANPCAAVTCGTGQTCSNGACKCTTGMLCANACVDTQNDQSHCGDCMTACATGGACVSGKCVNPTCNPDTQQRSGHITTYNLATSMVACHYPTSTLPQYYGAMNEYDWNNSGVCGACVEITNGGNKLVVQITDECPFKGNEQWCKPGSHHIDLNGAAYGALGANNNPAVTWKYVPCQTTGNLKYYFDVGSQQYYLAVTPMNATNLVSKMEVIADGAYVPLTLTNYHTFELKTGAGTGALKFRLTDIYNHVVVDTATLSAGQVVQGTKQFAACP
ncbi:MAG: expansin EXLX1 family cellulose-binding protein [Pseudomonadota bacterium]